MLFVVLDWDLRQQSTRSTNIRAQYDWAVSHTFPSAKYVLVQQHHRFNFTDLDPTNLDPTAELVLVYAMLLRCCSWIP